MQTEADYYALFEAYQRGELAAGARASLEARLSTEPRLQQLYAEYQELTGTLAGYAERRRTRQQIAALHTAMLAAEATPSLADEAAPSPSLKASVNPLLRLSRTEQKLRDFWSGHRATMGVAASVAVLAVFGTLLGLEAYRTSTVQHSEKGYTMLVREVNKLKQGQRVLSNALNQQVPTAPTELPNKYSGTGFALTADGYLVTSAHVVRGADSLLVEGRDHQRYHAETVYADRKHDLAILRIKDRDFKSFGKLPYTFKPGQADLGERVYTLGYPREDVVYGEGALSARSGYDGDTAFYQVSIPLNPGNSGGPLLDAQGNLIGVVNGRQEDVLGAAFATKSSYLVRLVDSLQGRRPEAAYHLPHLNQLVGTGRPQQLKRLQDFVFVVKVYEK